jgi:hypothetical protein
VRKGGSPYLLSSLFSWNLMFLLLGAAYPPFDPCHCLDPILSNGNYHSFVPTSRKVQSVIFLLGCGRGLGSPFPALTGFYFE